jgi:hypothetical protein
MASFVMMKTLPLLSYTEANFRNSHELDREDRRIDFAGVKHRQELRGYVPRDEGDWLSASAHSL